MATPYLYLVVPCYNEAERLKKDIFADFASRSDCVHFVFVDDGSSDSTASVLNGLRAGLEDRIEVCLKDYRLLEGKFDKIVSVEMIEAVGHEFLGTYFAKLHDLLKKDGVLALQMILPIWPWSNSAKTCRSVNIWCM